MTKRWPVISVWRSSAIEVLITGLFLGLAGTSLGQPADTLRKRPTPFSRYVPANARVFVTIRDLEEVEAALNRAHARQLLPFIAGNSLEAETSLDLRTTFARFLGPDSTIKVEDIAHAEVGLLADSWSQLGGAVWFFRSPSAEVLENWFPAGQRQGGRGGRSVWFFRTPNGLRVIVRDDVVAMARRTGAASLFSQVGRLMIGRSGEVLEQAKHYQELYTYLPGHALAVAYLSPDRQPGDESSAEGWLWPALDRAAVAMYERDGRIDFAIRGRRARPDEGPPVSLEAFGKLSGLPATSLLASATTVDFQRAVAAADKDPKTHSLGRYLKLLASLGEEGADADKLFELAGSQVITAWDQDLSGTGTAPQIAVLVQCRDARAVRDALTQIARNLVKLMTSVQPVKSGDAPRIVRRTHLGTAIVHLLPGSYAAESGIPTLRRFKDVQFSWAARESWLILALDPVHIERILDAESGLAPRLESVPDVGEINYYRANRTLLMFVQAKLAAAVLGQWLDLGDSGRPALLLPPWRAADDDEVFALLDGLGFTAANVGQAGVIVVNSVDAASPVADRLRADDRILGVDGHLLSLQHATQDFCNRVRQGPAGGEVALRVQRGDAFLDVGIPRPTRDSRGTDAWHVLMEGVSELVSLGNTLQFATFSVHATPQADFSARLTLRLTPVGTADAG